MQGRSNWSPGARASEGGRERYDLGSLSLSLGPREGAVSSERSERREEGCWRTEWVSPASGAVSSGEGGVQGRSVSLGRWLHSELEFHPPARPSQKLARSQMNILVEPRTRGLMGSRSYLSPMPAGFRSFSITALPSFFQVFFFVQRATVEESRHGSRQGLMPTLTSSDKRRN